MVYTYSICTRELTIPSGEQCIYFRPIRRQIQNDVWLSDCLSAYLKYALPYLYQILAFYSYRFIPNETISSVYDCC